VLPLMDPVLSRAEAAFHHVDGFVEDDRDARLSGAGPFDARLPVAVEDGAVFQRDAGRVGVENEPEAPVSAGG
jgi:hypothetical protein